MGLQGQEPRTSRSARNCSCVPSKPTKVAEHSLKPVAYRDSVEARKESGWDEACLGVVSHPTDGLLPMAYVGCGLS